jgi:hypothetical protein
MRPVANVSNTLFGVLFFLRAALLHVLQFYTTPPFVAEKTPFVAFFICSG